MKTAIYLRVSTQEQADNGYGLASQRTKCLAMAEVKGWEVVAEFLDEGISGTKDQTGRPGLAALLQAVCNGEIQAVIVAALDRLGRSTRIVLDVIEHLTECKAEIVSCKEAIDTSTPMGRFVVTVLAGLTQLDRENIVERTTAGRNERGKVDGDKGGRLPMGYIRGAAGVEIDPDEAGIVRTIFSWRRRGRTLTQIADDLNLNTFTSRRGAKWYASSVREVLQNEGKYSGGLRGDSQTTWPAILN